MAHERIGSAVRLGHKMGCQCQIPVCQMKLLAAADNLHVMSLNTDWS